MLTINWQLTITIYITPRLPRPKGDQAKVSKVIEINI